VLLSTLQKGTGTGSGGGSGKEYAIAFQVLGGVLGVASFTAVAVHHIDQREIRRIEGEQAVEIKRIEGERRFAENHWRAEIKRIEGERAAEIKRIESERKLSEKRWRAEVEKYKHDLQLKHTEDCKPYQAAKKQANKERGGTGGREKEEGTN